MRIGIDASRAVAGQRTGTEGYSYHVIRELLQIGRHQYTLYFNSPPAAGAFPPGPLQRIMPFPRLWTHLRLSLEMLRSSPDVLFVPSHVLPLIHPIRSAVTIHDVGYLYQPETHPRRRWWLLHLSTLWSTRTATLIIADSQSTRDDLVARYNVDPSRIRIVHLGCAPEIGPSTPEQIDEIRARYRLPDPYWLSVGTLQPRKNLARLIAAHDLARRSRGAPPVLALAGSSGWGASDIRRAAEPLGNAVRFLDYVPAPDLPALLSGAVALVFPSLYEGFGLPALEAMACGTPVIASAVSSLPEVVGDAGRLVNPTSVEDIADAMAAVANDAELRAEMKRRGLERASLFSWRRCAEQTLRVLEEAVEHRSCT